MSFILSEYLWKVKSFSERDSCLTELFSESSALILSYDANSVLLLKLLLSVVKPSHMRRCNLLETISIP